MSDLDFDGCFDRFTTSAFRLETLQRYAIPDDDPALLAWRHGRARPQYSVRTSAWAARLASTSIAGKVWRRVRAVDLPLSEYVRWEMAAYQESAVLGEDIRVLERAGRFADLAGDFWLFDAEGLDGSGPEPFGVAMEYDTAGRQGMHRLVTDTAQLRAWAQLAETTWNAAIALNEYVATTRQPLT